jgi:hypothetical protein
MVVRFQTSSLAAQINPTWAVCMYCRPMRGKRERRRLTLAPKPTRCADTTDEGEGEVGVGFFPDSDDLEEDWAPPAGECGGCSSVESNSPQADPLWGARKVGHGSRFWLLPGEDSSEEEVDDDEGSQLEGAQDFPRNCDGECRAGEC